MLEQPGMTISGEFVGTPRYMLPTGYRAQAMRTLAIIILAAVAICAVADESRPADAEKLIPLLDRLGLEYSKAGSDGSKVRGALTRPADLYHVFGRGHAFTEVTGATGMQLPPPHDLLLDVWPPGAGLPPITDDEGE